MNHILTLVASEGGAELNERHPFLVASVIGQKLGSVQWLAKGRAVDLRIASCPENRILQSLAEELAVDRVDFFVQSEAQPRKKKMLISDMDCTMVIGETLDELAAKCGLKEQVAAITERAMQGEVDYHGALRERVAMLRGLAETALAATCDEIRLMPGASTLVKTMRAHGATCILVSGGFSQFTDHVAAILGFHASQGNRLVISEGLLTGEVADPIVDHWLKHELLLQYMKQHNLKSLDVLGVGDGANDLTMLRGAGVGVGFHPKLFLF